ncbi:MAG: type II secretion system protein [Burkholderiales bacterium]|nr:type II secretion system protein [Burkholderiales bacterium]
MREVSEAPGGRARGRGFTMTELVVVIALVGLIAAIIGPRFVGRDTFASRAFFDEATQIVRYAQKISVAWRRPVFVCVTPAAISAGLAAGCPAPLIHPGTGAPLAVSAPGGVTLAGASFSFTAPTPTQAGGQPSTGAQVVITLNSTIAGDPARAIVIERETGYVH